MRRGLRTRSLLAGTLAACTAAAMLGSGCQRGEVPPGFARGTGRLEAEEIHVATRFPARVAEVLVDEGDRVTKDQILARMDAGALEAELAAARARVEETRQHRRVAAAELAQRESACALARKELRRAEELHARAVVSEAHLDALRTRLETAEAACDAGRARIRDVDSEIAAAEAGAARVREDLEDATLVAPRAGHVQYRLTEPGEVLAAGGAVVTLLDLEDVSMSIFLPAAEAGRTRVGSEARVLLDAQPEHPLAARVSFVAREAQFTPRQVETESERQKLSFRVEVQVTDPRGVVLNPGSPGVAWVRLDDDADWPERLRLGSVPTAP